MSLKNLEEFSVIPRKLIADVLGSPTLPSDFISDIASDINSIKNTLATILTNKGQSASASDTLVNLVSKVSSISTGKKWASGSLSFGMISKTTPVAQRTKNVTGLAFKPNLIYLYDLSNGYNTGLNFGYISDINGIESKLHYAGSNTASSDSVNDDGFAVVALDSSDQAWTNCTIGWLAIE